jgi:hypothetical protein
MGIDFNGSPFEITIKVPTVKLLIINPSPGKNQAILFVCDTGGVHFSNVTGLSAFREPLRIRSGGMNK